jgi:hypothetical protein
MRILGKQPHFFQSKAILLPILIILVGFGIIMISVGVDLLGMGKDPGFGANQLLIILTGISLLLSGMVIILPANQRYFGEWLIVGVAAAVVIMTADLTNFIGEPNLVTKLFILPFIALAVGFTHLTNVSTIGTQSMIDWLIPLIKNRQHSLKLLIVAAQLILLLIVIRQYDLESSTFSQNIMGLTFYGFTVHFFLPHRYKLPFFSFISLFAILSVFKYPDGLWLIGTGLGLITICHLPIRMSARLGILTVASIFLFTLRAEWLQAPWSGLIWPTLTSIFMFRMITYVNDLRQQKEPVNLWRSLSYFFLFPNIVFPFFPVISHSAFRRNYYDKDQYQIYQTGVNWIFRGVTHLILYRLVSYYLVIGPEEVVNTRDLVQFLISNFALYLRVSGLFHLIIGILHLFGFNLPETNHLYFLASNFTDLWRRINIYWKDFMLWNFYYPAYFRIRHVGETLSIVLVTAFIFLLTWFFHAYQWFWLRGSFLISLQDILFWTFLAILVIINTLYEVKRGRKRTLGQQTWTIKSITSLAFRTAGTFSIMAILWSLWTSDSIQSWFSLWSLPETSPLEVAGGLILAFLGVILVFSFIIWIEKRIISFGESRGQQSFAFQPALTNIGLILLIIFTGRPIFYSQLPGGQAQELFRDLTVARLNARDASLLQRGYYEDLIGVNRFNSQLWEVYMNRPENDGIETTRLTGDFIKEEIKPLMSETYLGGLSLRTNYWGMRDKFYEKHPPSNTYRIAVLGPSTVMGWGVSDDETFESILEDRLDHDSREINTPKIEVLNFGVPGYSAFQILMAFETKVVGFEPNAVFYIANQYDEGIAIQHLSERILAGVDVPYTYLTETVRKAGIHQDMSQVEAEKRLKPFGPDLISWAYTQIVEQSREKDILPVWIFMPTPEINMPIENIASLTGMAERAGFEVLDLSDVFEGVDIPSIWLAEWDHHPNSLGHKLLADRLYQAILENEVLIFQEPDLETRNP